MRGAKPQGEKGGHTVNKIMSHSQRAQECMLRVFLLQQQNALLKCAWQQDWPHSLHCNKKKMHESKSPQNKENWLGVAGTSIQNELNKAYIII